MLWSHGTVSEVASWVQFCHSVADFVAWPLTASVSELQRQTAQPEVEGLFIHVRFSMAVNGIEQQHKLITFNMRNLWHNLGITWKDGESCQNRITNHVHHPQSKTSLAWTCRKNGRWMHPKRPFLWRNEKRECPQLSRGLWMCVNETWRAPNTHWPLGGNCLGPWIMEGWKWVSS